MRQQAASSGEPFELVTCKHERGNEAGAEIATNEESLAGAALRHGTQSLTRSLIADQTSSHRMLGPSVSGSRTLSMSDGNVTPSKKITIYENLINILRCSSHSAHTLVVDFRGVLWLEAIRRLAHNDHHDS